MYIDIFYQGKIVRFLSKSGKNSIREKSSHLAKNCQHPSQTESKRISSRKILVPKCHFQTYRYINKVCFNVLATQMFVLFCSNVFFKSFFGSYISRGPLKIVPTQYFNVRKFRVQKISRIGPFAKFCVFWWNLISRISKINSFSGN